MIDLKSLTPRERFILRMICEGFTNREIGSEMFIAETNACGNLKTIVNKLEVRNRTAAAAEGVRRRWVE